MNEFAKLLRVTLEIERTIRALQATDKTLLACEILELQCFLVNHLNYVKETGEKREVLLNEAWQVIKDTEG